MEQQIVDQKADKAVEDVVAQQLQLLKRMHTMGVIRTAACVLTFVVVLCSALFVLPGINQLTGKLTAVANDLEKIDITYMTESVTTMAVTGTQGIETALMEVKGALENLNRLDIDALNKSIEDLGAVVEPLARFFGRR